MQTLAQEHGRPICFMGVSKNMLRSSNEPLDIIIVMLKSIFVWTIEVSSNEFCGDSSQKDFSMKPHSL